MAISKRKISKKQFAHFDESKGSNYLWLLENEEEKQTVLDICESIYHGTIILDTQPMVVSMPQETNDATYITIDLTQKMPARLGIWHDRDGVQDLTAILPIPQSLNQINMHLMGFEDAVEDSDFWGLRLEWVKDEDIHYILKWFWHDNNENKKVSQEIIAALF